MEWVETTGRTVDAARELALDRLGVDEEDLEVEVLAEPRGGLFGRFGGGEARIRARVKPISREKPGDRRRKRKRGGSGDSNERDTAGRESGDSGSGSSRSRGAGGQGGGRGSRSSGRQSSAGRGSGSRSSGGRGAGSGDGGAGRESGSTSERGSSGRTRGNGGGKSRPADGNRREVDVSSTSEVSIEAQAAEAEEFVRGLVEAFGFSASVTSTLDDDTINVEVDGENLGLLIGPRGATLTAVSDLTRAVVQRQAGGQGARLHVDVEGYRAKRKIALEAFAQGLIDQVLESGDEVVLDPMPSQDRKIVHDLVAEIEGVETVSEGEEPRRYVIIRRT